MKKYNQEEYLRKVILKKKQKPIRLSDPRVKPLINMVKKWGGDQIATIKPSGSSAKGTAVVGSADLDLFISLKSSTAGTLGDLYDSLYIHFGSFIKSHGIKRRRQNVSIRIFYKDLEVDFVPGKKMAGYHSWHSLHVRRDKKIWTQTNVDSHIKKVVNSGRVEEIILIKIWRDINKLNFPSIYLELSVINALRGKRKGNLESNLITIFKYLSSKGNFISTTILDPANGNNVISKMIIKKEKLKISSMANKSIKLVPDWKKIIY